MKILDDKKTLMCKLNGILKNQIAFEGPTLAGHGHPNPFCQQYGWVNCTSIVHVVIKIEFSRICTNENTIWLLKETLVTEVPFEFFERFAI